MLQEGYEKACLILRTFHTCIPTVFQHKSAPFKVADFYRWIVILDNRDHIEELRRAPDDTLSFTEVIHDVSNQFLPLRLTCPECRQQILQNEYTMGPEIVDNPYHVPIVRTQLTQNIEVLFPEIIDEISTAFHDVLNLGPGNGEYLGASPLCVLFMNVRDDQNGRASQCSEVCKR